MTETSRRPVRPESSYPLTGFTLRFETRWAAVLYHPEKKTIVCELRSDYVPIEHFKETFHKITELAISGEFSKFIFDKRALRTFHQPSMEWYFITWKTEMLTYGVKKHRKILPPMPWFKKAVEIEREQLLARFPADILSQLDIRYCATIEEALKI